MSGLLALLDDVAAIAKVAAASIDDVAGQAVKAGSKAAGVVIDDAAVTPKYVHGFSAERELPIIWNISLGSLRNKLLILLPVALLLSNLVPWMVQPLLMLGGAYLCFEGAEKIYHHFCPAVDGSGASDVTQDRGAALEQGQYAIQLEREKVAGAIKTDFVLSAEIMTIALAEIPDGSIWSEGLALALVGIAITALVYGGVALIVKADDFGLHLNRESDVAVFRAFGRGLVRVMPRFMALLSIVGTAAMLWVGGAIIIHALEGLGLTWPGHCLHDIAHAIAERAPFGKAMILWLVEAVSSGVLGLALGMVMIPVGTRIVGPVWCRFAKSLNIGR